REEGRESKTQRWCSGPSASNRSSGEPPSLVVRGKYFGGGNNRVAVNCDGILHALRVTSCVGRHNRNATRLCHAEYQLVAFFQAINRQRESPQLIFAIRICSGNVADQVRCELPQAGTQGVIQPCKIIVIRNSIRQIDVDGGRRLVRRVIMFLVQGNCEY